MKIVFWNIEKETNELNILADELDPDILLLAENKMSNYNLLNAVNYTKVKYRINPDPVCEKITMLSKFKNSLVKPITSGNRFTVRAIEIPNYPTFNLMCLHYQSKVNWTSSDQAAHSFELNRIISDFEDKVKSTNTILIGDFNMHPFDAGMVQSTGLHSVMTKDVAMKKQRKIDGRVYPFFYNPMWSFYGDKGKGKVSGTMYTSLSKPINYFWNLYDQVLIRPDLIDYFDEEKLEIITEFGDTVNLLTKNNLINKKISDHLPISIEIKNI